MDWFDQLILFIISLFANALSAFAGGGAGLVQLPALIFLGLPFGTALATHKIASVALGLGASFRHLRSNSLEKHFSLFILATGLPGVVLGSQIILYIPDRVAAVALGVLTVSLGCYSNVRPTLGEVNEPRNRTTKGYVFGGSVLFVIGILNGSLTSGTGLFVTLWLVYWFGLDFKRAIIYTLVLVGIFWNGMGAVTLGYFGNIKWEWLPALLLGSILGGYMGAHWAIKTKSNIIKRVFEVLTIVVGIKLILG